MKPFFFVNELGRKIGLSGKVRKDGFVILAIWSKDSCQSCEITKLEAAQLRDLLARLDLD